MKTVATPPDRLDEQTDLPTVLAAWHQATVRLEQTHETLREEVQRLTQELEVKNREFARKNRLADLGQIASHVAHEVRNSLVPVTLYMSLLRRRLSDDSGSCDVLDKIASGFAAVDTCVNDLLHFTADRDPSWEWLDVRRLLVDLLDSLKPQLEAQGIEGTIDIPSPVKLRADREMLPPSRTQSLPQCDRRDAGRRDADGRGLSNANRGRAGSRRYGTWVERRRRSPRV